MTTHPLEDQELLSASFRDFTGMAPTSIIPLLQHASERRIYRLGDGASTFIGVINGNKRENETFIEFARYFAQSGLPVPTIYHYDSHRSVYLEQDLGDTTLLDYLKDERTRTNQDFPTSVEQIYKICLEHLVRFQIECAPGFDFSKCYPERDLLPGTLTYDCVNFGNELVARILPDFDRTSLAGDFAALVSFVKEATSDFFVYRDFQSRNIMLVNERPFFIDFQSGRKGPLQYDVVSLLYQSSAQIPQLARTRLLEHYLAKASEHTKLDLPGFNRFYAGFIVCRMLQVLGVYGKQGLGAGKLYFANSIPYAVETLADELISKQSPIPLPQLTSCVRQLQDKLSQKRK